MNYEYLEIIEIKNEFFEVIISPKMPTKNYQVFCPGSLLEGKAETVNKN